MTLNNSTNNIKTTFYKIFWQSKTCQNIFLLSKEELLDKATHGTDESPYTYAVNKIIISNAKESTYEFQIVKDRSQTEAYINNISIENTVEYFKPVFENFYLENLEKASEKLLSDIEAKGLGLLDENLRELINPETRGKKIIELLQKYGFVGRHLNTHQDVVNYIERKFIPKKNNKLVNEQTISAFLKGAVFFKEIYNNLLLKRLQDSNQTLINILNGEDNFQSRIRCIKTTIKS